MSISHSKKSAAQKKMLAVQGFRREGIKMHFCCTFRYLSCPFHKSGLVKNTFLHVYSASHLSLGQAQIIS